MRIAYLGPQGTQSDFALRSYLSLSGVSAETKPLGSLRQVFQALTKGEVDACFVPSENSLQGPVTETLDLLFRHSDKLHISESYLASIAHALGALSNSESSEIDLIYSHEQALGQCAELLAEKFPQAKLLSVSSTAQGIEKVLAENNPRHAALAHQDSLQQAGLKLLATDLSGNKVNKTRFLLLKAGPARNSAHGNFSQPKGLNYVTSLVIDPARDRQGFLFEILQIVSVKHKLNLVNIQSRPDKRGQFVFYLDIEGRLDSTALSSCLEELELWCRKDTGQTASVHILGSYPQEAFFKPAFSRVGIIGGSGAMGRWFSNFFTKAGLKVFSRDLSEGLSMAELCREAEVIVLSVPMSAARSVLSELLPELRPGQLVVENCSIKHALLAELSSACPPGVEVLGLHTMFAADAELDSQSIILTPTASCGEKAKGLENLLYKYGARLSVCSIDEHDRESAVVQSLLHFLLLTFAELLKENPAKQLSTPNYRNFEQLIQRILKQSPELTYDLQTLNPHNPAMRKKFLNCWQQLEALCESKNPAAFKEHLKSLLP